MEKGKLNESMTSPVDFSCLTEQRGELFVLVFEFVFTNHDYCDVAADDEFQQQHPLK